MRLTDQFCIFAGVAREPISTIAAIATIGATGYSVISGQKRAEEMKAAHARQQKLIDEENARLGKIEEGQRNLRRGGRGLLAYADDGEPMKQTLG